MKKVNARLIADLARRRELDPRFEQGWMRYRMTKQNPVMEMLVNEHHLMRLALPCSVGVVSLLAAKAASADVWIWPFFVVGILSFCWCLAVAPRDEELARNGSAKLFVRAVDDALHLLFVTDPDDDQQWPLLLGAQADKFSSAAERHLLDLASKRLIVQESLGGIPDGDVDRVDVLNADALVFRRELRDAYNTLVCIGLARPGGYTWYFQEAAKRRSEKRSTT